MATTAPPEGTEFLTITLGVLAMAGLRGVKGLVQAHTARKRRGPTETWPGGSSLALASPSLRGLGGSPPPVSLLENEEADRVQ